MTTRAHFKQLEMVNDGNRLYQHLVHRIVELDGDLSHEEAVSKIIEAGMEPEGAVMLEVVK